MKLTLRSLLGLTIIFANTTISLANTEIDYLLSFVASSDCVFIRNGKEYQPQKAAEHLEYKYSHVRSRIKNAEMFIEKIASQSSFSKKLYEVQCGGVRLKTGHWLKKALASYRNQGDKVINGVNKIGQAN